MPIEYDLPAEEVESRLNFTPAENLAEYKLNASCHRFKSINGMLIPGGAAELAKHHPFYDTAHQLLKLALEANDRGDYFPVTSFACT